MLGIEGFESSRMGRVCLDWIQGERNLSRFDGLLTPVLVVGLLSGGCQNLWLDTDVFWWATPV